jgi:acetyl esterase/lipase
LRIRLSQLRLFAGGLCAGLSLLTVVEAPVYVLWVAELGATEWGHWLALMSLLLWLPGWKNSRSERFGAWLGLAAALLFVMPLARAVDLARALPDDLPPFLRDVAPRSTAEAPPRTAPLVPTDLLLGVASADVVVRSIDYAVKGEQPLSLDLYQPAAVQRAPGVVVVHGGSWRHGDRAELTALNRYLAARGYVVASVSYRFAPRWPFPAARDDVRDAVVFLKSHADEYGLDAQRLVLAGRSAGGQLALLVAYTTPDPAIRGAVSFYAPADMRYGYEHPSNPWVLDSTGVLEAYLGGNPSQVPAVYDAASPIGFVSADTVPTLLVHGGRDELVFPAHSERLAARLARAQRPYYFLRLPWATHGCDVNFSGPCGQISTYVIERFLAVVTQQENLAKAS